MILNELLSKKRVFNLSLNKFVIFCHSYGTVIPVLKILSLIKTYYSEYNITIVVNLSNLYLYLTKIFQGNSNISIHYIGLAGIVLNRPQSIIKETLSRFKILIKYNNITNTNVIFSSKNFVVRDYFILRLLRGQRSNHFCYIDKFSELKVLRKRAEKLTIKKKLELFLVRIMYGKDLNYYRLGRECFLGVNDNYLNRLNVVKLKEMNSIIINNYERYEINVPFKIIYFDDGLFLEDKIIDQNKFKLLLTEIFKRINKIGIHKDKIGIKFHPSFKGYLPILEYGTEIGDFIPADFLKARNCKLIFTVFSTVLNTFENDVIKISIINLLPWIDKERYKIYKKILIEDRQVSFIPQNIDEFIEILSKINTL